MIVITSSTCNGFCYVLLLYRIALFLSPPSRSRYESPACVYTYSTQRLLIHVQRQHFAVHSPFGRVYRHRSFPGSTERASFLLPAGRDTLIPSARVAKVAAITKISRLFDRTGSSPSFRADRGIFPQAMIYFPGYSHFHPGRFFLATMRVPGVKQGSKSNVPVEVKIYRYSRGSQQLCTLFATIYWRAWMIN